MKQSTVLEGKQNLNLSLLMFTLYFQTTFGRPLWNFRRKIYTKMIRIAIAIKLQSFFSTLFKYIVLVKS
jgi:hypothetical protein